MELASGPAVLRRFQPGDAERLAQHANSRAIWLNLRDLFPHPYSVEDAERYIEATHAQAPVTSFAIAVEGRAVGGMSLRPGNDIERLTAELGYWLGEAFWGRGIVSAGVVSITEYAFAVLGLLRVFAVPFVRNPASARVLEKAGYVREAVMRCSAVKEGELLDQYLYAAVRPAGGRARGLSADGTGEEHLIRGR
ncbi:MAG TPA: GNAT family N-acetyltransferase [Gemmatimonadales bacterium]